MVCLPLPCNASFARPGNSLLTLSADESRGYDRERSRSPRADRRDMDDVRARSASPNGRDSR